MRKMACEAPAMGAGRREYIEPPCRSRSLSDLSESGWLFFLKETILDRGLACPPKICKSVLTMEPIQPMRTCSSKINLIPELNLRPFAASCAVCNKMTTFRCSCCQEAYYCSRPCQRADASTHKPACRKPTKAPYIYMPPAPAVPVPTTSIAAVALLGFATAAGLEEANRQNVEACVCQVPRLRSSEQRINSCLSPFYIFLLSDVPCSCFPSRLVSGRCHGRLGGGCGGDSGVLP
jgi:hypothetical protein